MDGLYGWVKVDMVCFIGLDFEDFDNCLFSFWMVKNKLIDVAMFGLDWQNVYVFEFLYKRYVMMVCGSFWLVILVNMDMINVFFV